MPKATHIAILGHSHIRALQLAEEAREHEGTSFEFLNLRDGHWCSSRRSSRGVRHYVLKPALLSHVAELSSGDAQVGFIFSIGGNHHNVVGLTRHPEPFCFMNPWKSVDNSGKRVLPFQAVKEVMRSRMGEDLRFLRKLTGIFPRPALVLQVPPPVQLSDTVPNLPGLETQPYSPGRLYRKLVLRYGVESSSHRYAVWRLQSEIQEEVCKDEGLDFFQVPGTTLDSEGFLKEQYSGDPTHGNKHYGELILQQLEQYSGF